MVLSYPTFNFLTQVHSSFLILTFSPVHYWRKQQGSSGYRILLRGNNPVRGFKTQKEHTFNSHSFPEAILCSGIYCQDSSHCLVPYARNNLTFMWHFTFPKCFLIINKIFPLHIPVKEVSIMSNYKYLITNGEKVAIIFCASWY